MAPPKGFFGRRTGTIRLDFEALPEGEDGDGQRRHDDQERKPLGQGHNGTSFSATAGFMRNR